MNADAQSARDDLAFLRALVGDDASSQSRSFGEAYFASGLIYGGQMLLHAAQALGWISWGPLPALLIGVGPTIVFIPVLSWIIYRNRKNTARGAVGRAVAAVFAAIGLANLFLIAVIGSVAWREHSATTWLIYPCAVFVLQGAAWLFAYMMRRRAWLLAVALGWFACAVAMAICVTALGYFILFAGAGLWVCMALPGWLMLRQAARMA
ncbi:MAG TPA: hypothetical protein VNU97_04225 [Rhizomicrobium sp.]|jgi:hypothetical protein|nr:hypothetical protein [Rhizomicrobium sp.]